MNKPNRDLLVLFKQGMLSPHALEIELHSLHQMLLQTERLAHIVTVHELIDLNRYKVIRKQFEIQKLIRSKKTTPFVFLNNLN
jgi:hypothetical protein